ncbi:hypothetical protein F4810DRAFT_690547 [Camillea tinctor]|nr:hypothetical protein F4810DRAFT_690547 [Camillea tinctor]
MMVNAGVFDISPEGRAGTLHFLYRQFLFHPPLVSPHDVDLRGKTAIVTGSNSGIGFECARQLLDLGLSKLIIAVRDLQKGEASKRELHSTGIAAAASIEVWKLDLSSYGSILEFAEQTKSLERLDIAILNAGVLRTSMVFNENTGHEEGVQVNYLSTALLLILMLPIIQSKNPVSRPGRLVLVSSDQASWSKFEHKEEEGSILSSLDKKTEQFDPRQRYATTKLLGQLFLVKLTQVVPASVAIINCANPGLCYGSGLSRDVAGTAIGYMVAIEMRLLGRLPAVGARVIVDAATKHGTESHGQYIEDCQIRPLAPLVYTAEGERLGNLLWEETMRELAPVGVRAVLEKLRM